jgi:hypothetical protein
MRYHMIKQLSFRLTTVTMASLFILTLSPWGGAAGGIDLSKPFPLVLLEQEGMEENPFKPYFDPCDSLMNIRINSDNSGQVQNEEQVAHNRTNPDNLVAVWRDFRLGYRRIGVGYSFDAGATWVDTLMHPWYYYRHSDPGITVDRLGNFYACILSFESSDQPNGLFIYPSSDGGVTWNEPITVVDSVENAFEDKQLAVCDRTGGAFDGNLYVSWTRFWYGYYSQIWLARYTGGTHFEEPILISEDSGVQWPVPVVGADGEVYVAWVWYQIPSILFDKSVDGGETFGADQVLAYTALTSAEINGGILIFAFPAMDADITGGVYHGNIYCAYTDRQPYDDTNIFFTRSTDRGQTWSTAIRLNDDDPRNECDQFHPWLYVDEQGVIHVIFYDRRNDEGRNLWMDVYYTRSTDGGETFSPNMRITTESCDPTAGTITAGLLGEYIGLTAYDNIIHPVWTDTREGNQDVYTASVDVSTGVEDEEERPIPTGFVLHQNYPNPFNSGTGISFRVPYLSEVRLYVYNPLGQKVATLLEGSQEPGIKKVTWEAADLPSGIYFYKLTAGDFSEVKKMVLMK